MLIVSLFFLTNIFISCVSSQSLYDVLNSFQFYNEGVVSGSDIYEYQHEYTWYTEPENATRQRFAWVEGGVRPYLYKFDPSQPVHCESNPIIEQGDLPGADFLSIIPQSTNVSECHTLCCAYATCAAWTYAASAPADYNGCKRGLPCCYLKNYVPPRAVNPTLTSAIMNRTFPYEHPPTGLRSAVPLGGVTTGSIELRADGTFHEWTVENQSPAGGAKYGFVGDALLAFRMRNMNTNVNSTRLIRTHPTQGFQGVPTIRYHGAYPVSKLELIDESLPIHLDLYAYSVMKAGDLNRSITPAIVFSLNIQNPNNFPVGIDFMFNAPLSAQIDQFRYSKNLIQQMSTSTFAQCLSNCNANPSCSSWNWNSTGSQPTCFLYGDVGYNGFMSGFVSGVRGQWSSKPNGPLILDRPGYASAHGQYALWPVLPSDTSMSTTVDNDLGNILSNFTQNGGWPNQENDVQSSGVYGAVSVSTILKPSESKTLSILFAWYFPHHNWLDLPLDNFYTLLFHDVTDVGRSLNVDQGDSGLKTVATDILTLHRVYTNSTLPDYLIDTLINSASHMRSAMYFANGDWRQWEAYDCDDVDSVHNDHQRHLPYMLYFPETEKIKMYGWAKYQQKDGMIQEAFTVGCMGDTQPYDAHGGRSMGDVTSIFIIEVLELYRWTDDMKFLQDMYPHVVAGIKWQLSVSAQLGLPEHLECTYDIPNMSQYPTTTFNSFMHLAVLRATMDLALIMDDSATFFQCFDAFVTAQKQVGNLLWYNDTDTTGYFLAYTGGRGEKAIFTDALYGQVLAFTYDLGVLYDKANMLKHLQSEVRLADTPYGLRMLTGREPLTNPQDNAIWMGASQDWSVLNLWLGMDAESALTQAAKGMNLVRSTLNDQWNVHGLYGADEYGVGGKPFVTSHYGFHMVLWHLPFAVSGQRADLSRKSLLFSPKVKAPYKLPVLIPNIFASLTASPISDDQFLYTFTLLIGNLSLDVLGVNDANYPGTINLVAGQSVHWVG